MSTAFTNLQAVPLDSALPSQNASTNGKALVSNGTTTGWNTVVSMIGPGPGQTSPEAVANHILPAQAGASGKVLSTNGAGVLQWVTASGGATGVTSLSIDGVLYTGPVTITNVPSATTAGNVSGTVGVANGGTGATNAAQALTNLGAAAFNHTHNYAPTLSPAFTGTPTAPTAPAGTNTTQVATTAFVANAVTAATVDTTIAFGPGLLTVGFVYPSTNFFLPGGSGRTMFGAFGNWKVIGTGGSFYTDYGDGTGLYALYLIQHVA